MKPIKTKTPIKIYIIKLITFLNTLTSYNYSYSQIQYDSIQTKHYRLNKIKSRTQKDENNKVVNTIYIDTNGLITSFNYTQKNHEDIEYIEKIYYTTKVVNDKLVYLKTETKHENLLPFQIDEYIYKNNLIIYRKYRICNVYGNFSISKNDSIRKNTKAIKLPESGFILSYKYSKNRLTQVKYTNVKNWSKVNIFSITFKKTNGVEKYYYDKLGKLKQKKSTGQYFGEYITNVSYSKDTIFYAEKNIQKNKMSKCYIIFDNEGKISEYGYDNDENQNYIKKYYYDRNGLITNIESIKSQNMQRLSKSTFVYTYY